VVVRLGGVTDTNGGADADATAAARWIELDGAVKVRDHGRLRTVDGRLVQPGRLIRSDNLQDLSDRDVERLVGELGVHAVADLRTEVEVSSEGPGPLAGRGDVDIHHLSLFPESGTNTDAAAGEDEPVVLPWQLRDQIGEGAAPRSASPLYRRYLDDRADSVLDALRLIAHSEGATIVHCAAGKDRTGVVVALALCEVGVERAAVVADYARSAERIQHIFDRLRTSHTYAGDLAGSDADKHAPRANTIENLLDVLDREYGGPSGWLRAHGWTDADSAALHAKLLAA
jgi:protein-tyrosine phosphatase